MTEHMTIESFFLADYERLRNENKNLKAKLEIAEGRLAKDGGFSDLGKKVDVVNYHVNSSYSVFSSSGKLHHLTVEELKEIAEKSNDDLWKWAAKTDIGSYYGKVATSEARVFPFSVSFTSYKGTFEYAYDPDKSRQELVAVEDEPCLDCWVQANLDDGCKVLAIAEVRDIIEERIAKLEKEQETV